ncbi:polygalacturonase 1 beta-like protein 3 [Senna tora]|uniref:Polygalacturonase 1 beta-like protein 3 n=1 Tax=Senna tora TaxID=362788 RepID=A0A834SSS3_9FABA|nr:polygalacturonase 1 beta-like protein 3 [Senna tora]
MQKQYLSLSLPFLLFIILSFTAGFAVAIATGGISGDAVAGEKNPFSPKAFLIRYWDRKITNKLPKPSFLLSKASPLTAKESAAFTRLAASNALSTRLPEFCSSAHLLCFPDLGATLEKHSNNNAKFTSYHDKKFTNYGTGGRPGGEDSFKNYSNGYANDVQNGFRRYSRGSTDHRDNFQIYGPGGNIVGQSFKTYGAGANGSGGDFKQYGHSINIPEMNFTSYSDDADGRSQTFSSYTEDGNVGNQSFTSYGKNSDEASNAFSLYSTFSNLIRSNFTNYGENSNGEIDKFTSYSNDTNGLANNFNNYGSGGNGAINSFTNYRRFSNNVEDSFESYAKNSNATQIDFATYGKEVNTGRDSFTGYGKDAKGQKVGFKQYFSFNVTNTFDFKEYAKNGVSFKKYTNESSLLDASMASKSTSGRLANKWVEPGKFFRESMLKEGVVMPMPDIRDKMPLRSFLPRSILSRLPFSTSKISELKQIFKAADDSSMEKIIMNSLSECERAPSRGETKRCVGSIEDMIDFATSVLGRDVAVRTTENVNGSKKNVVVGSIKPINDGKVTQSVSCHQSLFPYLLYYCHSVPKVRVYEADLLDPKTKAKINHGVAICHLDTSAWSATHGAFVSLGSGPGRIEVGFAIANTVGSSGDAVGGEKNPFSPKAFLIGRRQTFSSYTENANTGDQTFTSYGKNGKQASNDFTNYGTNTSSIEFGTNFTNYGETAIGAVDTFANYGNITNILQSNFINYADAGNGAIDSFINYSNGSQVDFTTYGREAIQGTDTFTGYGKDAKGQKVGFKEYFSVNVSNAFDFKEYSKNGVSFKKYTNESSLLDASMASQSASGSFANKWVEPVADDSFMDKTIMRSLSECERTPSRGETKRCVGSIEDMIDFATSVLGRDVTVRATENVNGSKENVMVGSIKRINSGKVTQSVSCHQSLFPYLLYYCHSVPKVRVYEADLLDSNTKTKINHGVAICHLDTSAWSATHGAFLALGSGPGRIEVGFAIATTVGSSRDVVAGEKNPFSPKAFLIRYWDKKITNKLPKPSFLLSKASPLTATQSAAFTKLASSNALSTRLPEFCSSAHLLCFPDLRSNLEKHNNDSNKFTSYQEYKDFKNYGTGGGPGGENSFKNYSNPDFGDMFNDFRRYSRGSTGHKDNFQSYANGGNDVGETFSTYGAGATAGAGDFKKYTDSINVNEVHFTSYSDDANGRSQTFTSYTENSNGGDQTFSGYGKNGEKNSNDFKKYGTSTNSVNTNFTNYGETAIGTTDNFTSYGNMMNVPVNYFKTYGDGGNGAIDSFSNYRNGTNIGGDSFQSYAKNSNATQVDFTNYGKEVNRGTDTFSGYGKNAKGQKVGFKEYFRVNVSNTFDFLEYSKNGVSFAKYTNGSSMASKSAHGSLVNKWVEPGKFFRESMLKEGLVMPMPDIRDKLPGRSFLPRSILSNLPFSTSKISELKQIFKVADDSSMEKILMNSLNECERAPSRGETKRCVGSIQDMIDFVTLVLGRDVTVRTTENVNGSKKNVMVGSIKRINGGKVTQSVSCHQSLFPYLLYYCHSVPKVRVYEADLLHPNTKARINHGVAICHLDTSAWSATHGAFLALGSGPGRIEDGSSIATTVGSSGDAVAGEKNPFTPKAFLIRYWDKKITNKLPKPSFLLSKAYPLTAIESAAFTNLATSNALSTRLPEFCASAHLLCFPDIGASLEKHDNNGVNFTTYGDKNFTNYGTGGGPGGVESFKNYSNDIVQDDFRRYSRGSTDHKDNFVTYGPQRTNTIVLQNFRTYGAGATGGSGNFKQYSESVNSGEVGFTSYSDDANQRSQSFSKYSEFANFAEQGVTMNVPTHGFKNYGDGGNASTDEFTNYRVGSNFGSETFQSYAKNSDAAKADFTNYGNGTSGGDEFIGYGKGGKGQKVGFKGYFGVNLTNTFGFKEYAKNGVSFANYSNEPSKLAASKSVVSGSVVNKWVEPGKFFRESMLKEGVVMPMPDIRDKMPKRSFLPRAILSKLSFSTSKISELKQIFKVTDDSSLDKILMSSLKECERAPSRGETRRCVGSIEDMIDFATSVLGRDVTVRTTENVNGSKKNVMVGSIKHINGGKVTKSVSCHQSLFPYLLYYCHSVPKVRVYEADLLDPNTIVKINYGVAICHLDTSAWSATHEAFVALGSSPGRIEVCHWIFQNDMTWTIVD